MGDDFYSPTRPPRPRRVPQHGELLFEFLVGHDRYVCDLRDQQQRHIQDMFRLLELKRLAAANAIEATQQTELDDLQARTDATFEAKRATRKQTDVARAAKPEKDEKP